MIITRLLLKWDDDRATVIDRPPAAANWAAVLVYEDRYFVYSHVDFVGEFVVYEQCQPPMVVSGGWDRP